jgi:hypothetical protein
MTTKEAYKEIVDYFELYPSTHGEKRLMKILESVERPVPVIEFVERQVIVKDKPPVLPKNLGDLEKEVDLVCQKFYITYKQFVGHTRKTDPVRARVYFCRLVKTVKPEITSIKLSQLLRRDHSSICHYLYKSSAYCEIPPLENPHGEIYRETIRSKNHKVNVRRQEKILSGKVENKFA